METISKIPGILDSAGEISDSNNDTPVCGGYPSLIAELRYLNYRHNRLLAPAVEAENWRLVYGPDALEYEKRFNAEVANA